MPAVDGAVTLIDSGLVPDADSPLTVSVPTAVSDDEMLESVER